MVGSSGYCSGLFHLGGLLCGSSLSGWRASFPGGSARPQVLQVALNAGRHGAAGLRGAVQPRSVQPRVCQHRGLWWHFVLCRRNLLCPQIELSVWRSWKHPRPGIAWGCQPRASPSPTAASRPDSDERISLATASFGLPGYQAASPLSSGTWVNCWSASFAGAKASGSSLVLWKGTHVPAFSRPPRR